MTRSTLLLRESMGNSDGKKNSMTIEEFRKEPALVLEWFKTTVKDNWICEYYLQVPLRDTDIRWKKKKTFLKLKLGGTKTQTNNPTYPINRFEKEKGSIILETPFRDGAHIQWDSDVLNNIPMYVVYGDIIQRLPHQL